MANDHGAWYPLILPRHNQGCNVASADGYVKWVHQNDLGYNVQYSGLSKPIWTIAPD